MKRISIVLTLIISFFLVCFNAKADTFNSFNVTYDYSKEELSLNWDIDEEVLMYSVYVNDELYANIGDKNLVLKLEKNKFYNIKLVGENGTIEPYEANKKIFTGVSDNVAATLTNINSVKITYNKVEDASGYYIYRAINNKSNFSLAKKIENKNITRYDEINLEKGKNYYYRVIPYYKDEEIIYKGFTKTDAKVSTFSTSKVRDLYVKQTKWNNNRLTWDKKTGANGYKVYVSNKKKGNYRKIAVIKDNSFNHSDVKYGKTYYYKVVAYNNLFGRDIYGSFSNVYSRFVRPLSPRVKVNVKHDNRLIVNWTRESHITNYKVYRATSKTGKYKVIKTTKDNTYTDKKLKKNKTYYYKVRAVRRMSKKKQLYSRYSNIAHETTTERNAKYRLSLRSAYGDIEAYHPSVLYFKDGWNGYKYWLVFTPYPNVKGKNINGDSSKENPHIKVSNNLKDWITLNGTPNPLDTPVGEGLGKDLYNSDGELVYNSKLDRIECIWRTYSKKNIILYMSYTEDGVTWSEKEEIYNVKKRDNILLSPAIILDNDKYKMWYVDGYKVHYLEFDGIPFEKVLEKKTFNIEAKGEKIYPWHLEVMKRNNKYEMIYVGTTRRSSIRKMSLYYTSSSNNNKWNKAIKILSPSKDKEAWDNRGLYRSTFFYMDGHYYIIYCGSNRDNIKGTSIIYGKHIDDLYPLFD